MYGIDRNCTEVHKDQNTLVFNVQVCFGLFSHLKETSMAILALTFLLALKYPFLFLWVFFVFDLIINNGNKFKKHSIRINNEYKTLLIIFHYTLLVSTSNVKIIFKKSCSLQSYTPRLFCSSTTKTKTTWEQFLLFSHSTQRSVKYEKCLYISHGTRTPYIVATSLQII